MTRAHRGARRERLDAQVVLWVARDPALQLAQAVALCRLGRQVRAELRLGARAPQEEHQPARDGQRHLVAHVVLHQCQGQVDAGGDPGRGEHVAVTHEDRVGIDMNLGVPAGKRLTCGPVGGGAPSLEESCGGEQEGAGADRRDPT